jgi:hypothetical protein
MDTMQYGRRNLTATALDTLKLGHCINPGANGRIATGTSRAVLVDLLRGDPPPVHQPNVIVQRVGAKSRL